MLRRDSLRLATALATTFVVSALSAQTPVRLSWQSFAKDPKRVESLRKAVVVMKTRNLADPGSADFRTSWTYWGNMHGYFGTASRFGTVMDWVNSRSVDLSLFGLYFSGISNVLPPDATATAVWSQCQHGTEYFFAWHRLYLLYFEKVLQKAANDPTLRLPYWDYTNTANLGMPAEFTTPVYTNADGEVVPNPLYEPLRAPGWLASPFSSLDPDVTNINDALKNPYLLNTTGPDGKVVYGYQRTIELSPHGAVHCAVMDCPVAVMGAVPYSSNDPIFWLHHANIDRLWDCWASIPGHKNPDGDYLKQPFSYVDASGQLVTNTVDQIINGNMVDYAYEQASNCGRPEPVVLMAEGSAKPLSAKQVKSARATLHTPVTLGSSGAVVIDAPVTRKAITLPAAKAANAQPFDFALHARKDVPVKTELALRGIHYEAHPGAIFKVFLERTDDPSRRAFAGSLSFFEPMDGSGHDASPSKAERVFDVTDAFRALGTANMHDVTVVFEAATGRLGAEKAHFNPRAKLVVDNVELQVKLREEPPQK